jgi:glycosyltransferase involved in cell wall biosynthesis
MKILFLSRWFPYPADNGAKLRIYHLIQSLANCHTVDLISFTDGPVNASFQAMMEATCRTVETFPYRSFQPKRWIGLMGALSHRPRFLVDTYHLELGAMVKTRCAEEKYDLVIASQLDMFPYIEEIDGPAILLEELEVGLYIDRIADRRSLWASMHGRMTWWKLSRYLKSLFLSVDGCTTASGKEQYLINRYVSHDQKVEVIPNGAARSQTETAQVTAKPDTLIYAGSLTYSANFDAVHYFIHQILPLIQKKRPNVTLTVTGSLKGVDISSLSGAKGVIFAGYIDHIADAIMGSWASVVPLRVGGGTRLKILESLSLGTPVISTTKGMEGLDLNPEEEILIGNEPQSFANQVLRVLEDENLRNKLGQAGKQTVESKYDWQKIGETFRTCAENIARQARA